MPRPGFPEELLSLVFSNLQINVTAELPPKDGFPKGERAKMDTLVSLSRASKQFQRLVAPYLYRSIYIPYGDVTILELLNRSLVNSRVLTRYVKEIHVQGLTAKKVKWNTDSSRNASGWDDREILEECSEIFGLIRPGRPRLESALARIQGAYPDVLFTLLVFLCPNVEIIDLVLRDQQTCLLVRPSCLSSWNKVLNISKNPGSFSRLHTVRIQSAGAMDYTRAYLPSLLVKMPHVQVFSGENLGLCKMSSYSDTLDWRQYQSMVFHQLREIRLHDSIVQPTCIEETLRLCTNLITLEIHCAPKLALLPDTFGLIGRSLRQFGGKLQELVLDYTNVELSLKDGGSLGSLSALIELQELSLSMPMILGRGRFATISGAARLLDLLPKSLRTLHILPAKIQVDELDGHFFDMLTGHHLPSLRHIACASTSIDLEKMRDADQLEIWRAVTALTDEINRGC